MAKNRTTAEEQMAAKKKPQSIEDLAPDAELTEEEEAALAEPRDPRQALAEAVNPRSAIVEGAPPWAVIPPDLIIPKNVEVGFMNIKGRTQEWNVILWELSVRDERLARARTMGDSSRLVEESAKQMVRVINGDLVTGADPSVVASFWEDIGGKYRAVINTWFIKAHMLEDTERVSFFQNHVVARKSV